MPRRADRPCPECGRFTLFEWRESDSADPGDVTPRAACMSPDCDYEY